MHYKKRKGVIEETLSLLKPDLIDLIFDLISEYGGIIEKTDDILALKYRVTQFLKIETDKILKIETK